MISRIIDSLQLLFLFLIISSGFLLIRSSLDSGKKIQHVNHEENISPNQIDVGNVKTAGGRKEQRKPALMRSDELEKTDKRNPRRTSNKAKEVKRTIQNISKKIKHEKMKGERRKGEITLIEEVPMETCPVSCYCRSEQHIIKEGESVVSMHVSGIHVDCSSHKDSSQAISGLNGLMLDHHHDDNSQNSKKVLSLNLSSNGIKEIRKGTFISELAGNLINYTLDNNEMKEISYYTFKGLKNLENLSIRNNSISRIAKESLIDLVNLRSLDLSYNKLKEITAHMFLPSLYELTSLDLSHNIIETLRTACFRGIKRIQTIDLSSNVITTIADNVFKYSPELTHLNLHDNPIHCDCYFRGIAEYFIETSDAILNATCMYPSSLRNFKWYEASLDQMNCRPDIRGCMRRKRYKKIGSSVKFGCRIRKPTETTAIIWSAFGDHNNYEVSWQADDRKTDEIRTWLKIKNITWGHKGYYEIMAENSYGYTTDGFTLMVAEDEEEYDDKDD